LIKKIKIKLIAIIIIPSLLWISYNNSANWHFHRLEFGLLTSHSHIYDRSKDAGSPIKDHKHDKRELLCLDQIFHALMVWCSLSLILLILYSKRETAFILPSDFKPGLDPLFIQNVRGPPNGFVTRELI
jgi:uncharacterized membrane protein